MGSGAMKGVSANPMYNSFAPKSVLVSTDHSLASRTAFAHALAFSLLGQADLTVFDAAEPPVGKGRGLRSALGVRRTLRRWGLLSRSDDGGPPSEELGLRVKRVSAPGCDLLGAIAEHIRRDRTELLVFGIPKAEPIPAWLVGQCVDLPDFPLSSVMLVPPRAPGFVSLRDGALSLRQIVVAVDQGPDPTSALEAAARIAWSFSEWAAACHVLHMGGDDPRDCLPRSADANGRWDVVRVAGSQDKAIADATLDADLLVMSVLAQKGKDMLELILRGAVGRRARLSSCPVLLVPAGPTLVPES